MQVSPLASLNETTDPKFQNEFILYEEIIWAQIKCILINNFHQLTIKPGHRDQ